MKTTLPGRPGSLTWLAVHQLRMLYTVGRRGQKGRVVQALLIVALLLFVAAVPGYGIASLLREGIDSATTVLAGMIILALTVTGLSVSVMGAFAVWSDRGDLDLLLAAPMPPQRIAAARLLSNAMRAFLLYATFAVLFLGLSFVLVDWKLVSVFPLLVGIALIEGTFGFLVARWLLLRLGLRRGRMVSQALGMLGILGGVFGYHIGAQLSRAEERAAEAAAATAAASAAGNPPSMQDVLGASGLASAGLPAPLAEIVQFLGRGVLGGFGEALTLLAVGAVVLAGAMVFVGRRFADDAATLSGQQDAPRLKTSGKVQFARGAFRTGVRKEWRTMLRDPNLLTQTIIPVVALVPAGFAIFQPDESGDSAWIGAITMGGLGVFIITQITGSLAWVCMSVEEARDLVAAAPVDPGHQLVIKLVAVAGPTLAVLVLLSAGVATLAPVPALWCLVFGLISCLSITAIEYWRRRPAKRPKLTEKPDRSAVSILLGFLVSTLCGLAYLAVVLGWAVRRDDFDLPPWLILEALALVPLLLLAGVLALARALAPAVNTRADGGALPPVTGPWAGVASKGP